MNEPTPLPPLDPKPNWIVDLLKDPNIQRWIERIIMAAIATYFGVKVNSVHHDINDTKDVATNTNETQKAVVAVEVRGTPADVEKLKATTQEAK